MHFRDIRDILSNLLMLWFFATPIIYPWFLFEDPANPGHHVWQATLLKLNPFTHLAISYQELLFYAGPFGHWRWLLALLTGSIGLFLFGYFLFDRLRDSFAEEVEKARFQLPSSASGNARVRVELEAFAEDSFELESCGAAVVRLCGSGEAVESPADARTVRVRWKPEAEAGSRSWKREAKLMPAISEERVEDLPAAAAAGSLPRSSAPSTQPDPGPRVDETFAALNDVRSPCQRADARRDRRNGPAKHDAQAGGRNHEADDGYIKVNGASRRSSSSRNCPKSRPRERLHQRDHARPDQEGNRAPLRRDRRVRRAPEFIDAPVKRTRRGACVWDLRWPSTSIPTCCSWTNSRSGMKASHKCLDKFAGSSVAGRRSFSSRTLGLVERFADAALWLDGGLLKAWRPARIVGAYVTDVEVTEESQLAAADAKA